MRYFKLQNADKETISITTEEILFYDISGLGFEEENTFRSVGPVWRMNKSTNRQLPVDGKMCFTENGSTTPYEKYEIFKTFITKTPLILIYYPHGLKGKEYRKKVRVSELVKTELTKYGVLDCDITFTPYTPWYEVQHYKIATFSVDENAGWIWDVGNNWDRPASDTTSPRYKFGAEARNIISFDCGSNTKGFIKLTIHGPAVNPVWTHHVNGVLVETGGFEVSSGVDLTESDRLIIDNTEGQYSMTIENLETRVVRNVYSIRDFDKECFFTIEEGENKIMVSSADGAMVTVDLEGHFHYATV